MSCHVLSSAGSNVVVLHTFPTFTCMQRGIGERTAGRQCVTCSAANTASLARVARRASSTIGNVRVHGPCVFGARGAKPTTQNGTWEPTCHQRVPLVGNLARDAKGLAIERFDLVLFANEPHLGLLGRPTNQTLNINKQRRSCAQRDTHAVCTDRSERPLLLLLTLPQARVA